MQQTTPLSEQQLFQLAQGDTIFYHLSPNDLPKDPEKEWSGVITAAYPHIRSVLVRVLTEHFEGEEDEVGFNQIVRVEKTDDAQNPSN